MQTATQLFRLIKRRTAVHGPESSLGMALENAASGVMRAVHLADLREKVKHLLRDLTRRVRCRQRGGASTAIVRF